MELFWGDLHNHCGITYGSGSLKNALLNARFHLDFCSVTPHAFWPDMPARNEDTAFILDYHIKGFEKIRNNWQAYTDAIEKANQPGKFSTFYSFEMHSYACGDYTFVSPDKNLRITPDEDSPEKVIKANGSVRMIGIPHHIGYTPGYRGIIWDRYDGRYSPLVEVISNHGCAMHDYAGLPFYHDMGPMDGRNTVYSGLAQGKQFSFTGSTDNHAGCPGTFGDGKMAVLAEANTREAIWDSLLKGRTYAVTGNRIKCGFTVNGNPFGSIIDKNAKAEIDYSVEAGDALDRIVIFRNLKPAHIVDGLALERSLNGEGPYKVKIEFGWSNKDDLYRWDIDLGVDGGTILNAEPCFRGAGVISPSRQRTDYNEINDLGFDFSMKNENSASLTCGTYKNRSTRHPGTSAVIYKIGGNEKTKLNLKINGREVSIDLASLIRCGVSGHMKPYASHAWKIHTAVPRGHYENSGKITLPGAAGNFYHMEVMQRDNERAFISPVFMKY